MSRSYQPPYTLTSQIVNLIAKISEQIGRMTAQLEESDFRLRRINRIRTIQGSLAIEGNTLSEAQITAILEGKRVIAPPKDILEARNAIAAYEQFSLWQDSNEQHLLNAHKVLMAGLIDDAGHYRSGNVGVMNGDVVVHTAPPAHRVPQLMRNLLQWLDTTDTHPLISSSVFHYEFEFIHPFADGNGRMGRLWQTLIMSRWHPVLAQLPVESMIHAHQSDYYQALNLSTQSADSAPFIEFMLKVILETIDSQDTPQDTPQAALHTTPQVISLLSVMRQQKTAMNRDELQRALSLNDRKSFRLRYLRPALDAGFIVMTRPDTPNSSQQQYQLTDLGRRVAATR